MRTVALIYLLPFLWQYTPLCSSQAFASAYDTTYYDLCIASEKAARATTLLAQTPNYDSAVILIRKAQLLHYKEHVISFGKDSTGKIINSPISTGNISSGYIPDMNNRFADIHIHTNEHPPSSGDLYGFIDQITIDANYIRYIITPKGQAYALVLLSKKDALRFNTSYTRRAGISKIQADGTSINYQPTFPQQLVDEFNELRSWNGITHETALVILLKKYKMGIVLLKQDTNGAYNALDVREQTDHKGNKSYHLSHCR
ncbi:hypothetical protein [Niabella hibiscisoli]|uniref:hypothetical protein n=1 Tax=Niabella hibiscisoli TaxID=1825928 RepID=UPI001F0F6395|nr:hypothetical protein [Niabella hibiscisoli]MCH5720897.1 hypothetical protein [Niabella hibiscisoli]